MGSRTNRVKQYPIVAAGTTAASTATDTTSVISDARIMAGDYPIITPGNAAAAALMGNAAGLYAVTADGSVTITHAAAAGGEIFHVAVVSAFNTAQ